MISPFQEVIQFELDQLRKVTSSDFSGIAWIDERDNRIRWLYASGNLNERYKKLALKPGRGLAGMVIKLGRPLVIDAKTLEVEILRMQHDYPIMLVEQLRCFIAVPITIHIETLGVLIIGHRTERFYDKNVIVPLTNLADRFVRLFVQEVHND
jgi:nitrogen regulatory protein A